MINKSNIFKWVDRLKCKRKRLISFEENYVKCGLPIITLYNDSFPLNFIVDTGCTTCILTKGALKYLHYTDSKKYDNKIIAAGDNVDVQKVVNLTLNDGCRCLTADFAVMDMDSQFEEIEKTDKVTVHGIVGGPFIEGLQMVIDYKKLVIRV